MHTLGPWAWALDDKSDGWALLSREEGNAVLRPMLENIHGGVGPAYLHIEVTEPDRHLIAATPDLFAACVALLGFLEEGGNFDPDSPAESIGHMYGHDLETVYRDAKSAIDKANGSTSDGA